MLDGPNHTSEAVRCNFAAVKVIVEGCYILADKMHRDTF